MKKTKILYWLTTVIFSAMMIFSGSMYFVSSDMTQTFEHLGFPDYFRIELGIAKIIGAIFLVTPINERIKEWAYIGFTITLVSAAIAHLASSDPVSAVITPLVFLGILVLSYVSHNKLQENN